MQTLEKLVPGSFYHIYNRGNNGENLFVEERNYEYFLSLYRKYITPIADTFSYCLLGNHFHFLIRVKLHETCEVPPVSSGEPHRSAPRDPSRQFSHFFNSYAKSMNSAYGRTGSLFQERFRRKEVRGIDSLQVVVHYIHLNPLKHRFERDFRMYKHSSYRVLLADSPTFLQRNEVFDWFGGRESFESYHEGGSAQGAHFLCI